MKTPSALLLAGTLLVAGSAALLARVLLTPPPPPPVVEAQPAVEEPKPTYPSILVAARDLSPGDFLDAGAMQWKASDNEIDERLYYTRGNEATNTLTGASVRHPVAAGTALTSTLVVRPNEPGFIATVISPGMRAIAIPTNNTASLYSMVSLGDRVDVIVNLQRDQESGITSDGNMVQAPRLAAQTLLQNVRVLSINNQIRNPLQPLLATNSKASKESRDAYPNSHPEIVTLEVPPAYAERLTLASQIGTLQLVLRSSQEKSDGKAKPGSDRVTTLAETTSVYKASASSTTPSVKTFHGDAATAVQFGSR